MEMLDALSQTFDHTTKIVSGVRADQLDDQTPCSEWPLRTLLAHMTGVVVNMGLGASGKELLPSIEGFVIEPADLGAQFRSEADRTLAAWRTCSDGDEVNVGAGPMPASVALGINLLDTATHSWDVARCTGQDTNLPDARRACRARVRQADRVRRDPWVCGFRARGRDRTRRVADRSARRLSRTARP